MNDLIAANDSPVAAAHFPGWVIFTMYYTDHSAMRALYKEKINFNVILINEGGFTETAFLISRSELTPTIKDLLDTDYYYSVDQVGDLMRMSKLFLDEDALTIDEVDEDRTRDLGYLIPVEPQDDLEDGHIFMPFVGRTFKLSFDKPEATNLQ